MNFSVIRNADTMLGSALATALASMGKHVILLGSDLLLLEKIVGNLRILHKVKVFSIFTDDDATQSILKACEFINDNFQVDLFVNYTEVAFYGKFIDYPVYKLHRDLRSNYISGPIYTHQLLPNLMLPGHAYVLNLYSHDSRITSEWQTILESGNLNFSNHGGDEAADGGIIVRAFHVSIHNMANNPDGTDTYLKMAQALLDNLFQDHPVVLYNQ